MQRGVLNVCRGLTLLVCVWGLGACSGPVDPLARYHNKSATMIYQSAQKNLHKKNYVEAKQDLSALDAMYPFGEYAAQSQLEAIYANYMAGDSDLAIASADRYISLYPRSPKVAYALYMRGLANFDMSGNWAQRLFGMDLSDRDPSHFTESFGAFKRLVTYYPRSIYTPNALLRMAYIRNILAERNLKLAEYYTNRMSYLASSNRASAVIQNFQGAPSVIPALAMKARSDAKLGLQASAQKTWRLMQQYYPAAYQAYQNKPTRG